MTSTYDEGVSIEKLFPDDSIQDHVKSSDMWAGAISPIDTTEYVVSDGVIVQKAISYPPALFKCIDEAIVNSLDNAVRLFGTKRDNQTTQIDITFAPDGRFTIKNDGKGVPVGWHSGANKYSVELIFGTMFKGRAKTQKESKITGDENRVGIKIANIMSKEFEVTTVYHNTQDKTRTRYHQRWSDSMREVSEPVLTKSKEVQSTEVSFLLDYEDTFKIDFTPEYYTALNELFHFRAYQAASYIGYYTRGKCAVSYNGMCVPIKNMNDFAAIAHPGAKIISTVCKDVSHPWEVVVAIVNNPSNNKKDINSISNVNGIAVKTGRHIETILDQIIVGVKESIVKRLKMNNDVKFHPGFVYSNILIFANTQIPGVRWSGQRKDEAICELKKIAPYTLSKNFINTLTDELTEPIMQSIYEKNVVIGMDRVRKDPLVVEKYERARLSGQGKKKQPSKCSLLLPEGDSAAGMCQNGLTYKPSKGAKPLLGMDYYGIMTLRGVIVNIRKKNSEIVMPDGTKVISLSKDITDNAFFRSFVDALGLDLNARYDKNSPTYEKEKAALNYGCIIACVDQDHDGSGFIFPLLANIFDVLWPNLLAEGFVKKWDTPRRRAYPKRGGKVLEFYSEADYAAWEKENPNARSMYKFEYIKGLGGHEEKAAVELFKKFNQHVITYYPDDKTSGAFETMFGKESAPRKEWLQTPVETPDAVANAARVDDCTASLTELIHHEGKEHALSNVAQKLWSAIDGMNESGRKILDGSLAFFANRTDKAKVVTLQGYITQKEHYQHGEASMHESLCGKSFICVGGVQLPQLLPKGNFGTRKEGGADHAQVRYIFTLLNKKLTNLLYPAEDYQNYSFVYEDGERAEPTYFAPILPMAVLENVQMPAHGWRIKVWARDVFNVIRKVRTLITHGEDAPLAPPIPSVVGFKGEFREIRGKTHCFGDYVYDERKRTITITELPLRVWHGKYVRDLTESRGYYCVKKGAKKSEDVVIRMFKEVPINRSSNDFIDIQIELERPDPKTGIDPLDIIMNHADDVWSDGFEEYFRLHIAFDDNLSMIATDGSVRVFDAYEDVIRYWFPVRRHFYEKRVERQLMLLDMQILFIENTRRYINEFRKLKMVNVEDDKAIGILREHTYDRFNHALLQSRGHETSPVDRFLPTDKLEGAIVNSPDATYDYLLNTRDRDKLERACIARNKKYKSLVAQREELIALASKGRFNGAAIWLQELDEIEDVIRRGFATNWMFGEGDKFRF